jgi:hypothetical protein
MSLDYDFKKPTIWQYGLFVQCMTCVYGVVPIYLICIQNSVSSHSLYCMLTLIMQRMLSFDNHWYILAEVLIVFDMQHMITMSRIRGRPMLL